MNKDIDILKECKRLSVDRDTGRKGPVQARSAEAGGWRMVDHGRPHWPLPSRCWESLSILSKNKPCRYLTKNIPVRGNNKGKDLEVRVSLVCSWTSREANVAGIQVLQYQVMSSEN